MIEENASKLTIEKVFKAYFPRLNGYKAMYEARSHSDSNKEGCEPLKYSMSTQLSPRYLMSYR